MIRDVFDQPHQAMVMAFFGLAGGLGYESLRLPRLFTDIGNIEGLR